MGEIDQRCDLCKFWDNSTTSAHPNAGEETGYCRRSPPGFDDRTGLAVWPFTDDADWCGEFQLAARSNSPEGGK